VEITHAGTAEQDGRLVTAGGRVLNVTGLGPTLEDARGRAYAAVERIHFDGAQYRSDIAARVAERVAI
jgi:phosphoribosylamine-glycine ligase